MLTNEQIEAIENFCIQEGIRYYDFRQEMVDHLARQTETILANSKEPSFSAAFSAAQAEAERSGLLAHFKTREEMLKRDYLLLLNKKIIALFKSNWLPLTIVFLMLLSPRIAVSTNVALIILKSYIIAMLLLWGAFASFFWVKYLRLKQPVSSLQKVLNGPSSFAFIFITGWMRLTNALLEGLDYYTKTSFTATFFIGASFLVLTVVDILARIRFFNQSYQKITKAYPALLKKKSLQ